MLEQEYNLEDIDHFLQILQEISKRVIGFIKYSKIKRLSSIINRHTLGDSIITVDHPYVVTNDPSNNIQNIPIWI